MFELYIYKSSRLIIKHLLSSHVVNILETMIIMKTGIYKSIL